MDKHFKLWFLCFCFPLMLFSQERNIAITPLLPAEVDIPESLRPMLQQKLLQIATTNGYGSESDDFILTANVMVLEKTAVPTVPPQINLTLEVSLYVINRLEKVIVAEKSVQIGGIDKTENSAYTQALKQLNPRKPEIRSFMTSAREKIVEYYTEKLPALLSKAQSLADMGDTDEALAVLSTIPEVVPDYPLVAELMSEFYLESLDTQCAGILREAQGKLAVKNYEDALDLLVTVDPLSSHFQEAGQMIDSIRSMVLAEEEQQYAMEWQLYQQQLELAEKARADEVMLKKMQLEASYKYADQEKKQNPVTTSEADSLWLMRLIGR